MERNVERRPTLGCCRPHARARRNRPILPKRGIQLTKPPARHSFTLLRQHKSQNQPLTDTARTSVRCSPLSTHAPVMPHPLVAFPNATASLFGAMLTPLCMHLWRSEPLALCARCVLHTHPVYSCRRCCADVQRHTGRSSLLELPTALITKLPC